MCLHSRSQDFAAVGVHSIVALSAGPPVSSLNCDRSLYSGLKVTIRNVKKCRLLGMGLSRYA